MSISVHILTKNSAATLLETLQSLTSFAEVIVFDTGSTDATLEIAARFPNVMIHKGILKGFGPTHNEAAALSSYDWILSIDSDEVLSPNLIQEIHALSLDPTCVYSILRDNYLNSRKITFCAGWYPDWVIRLYNRNYTSFSNEAVHEKVLTKNLTVQKLRSTLKHVPYRTTADFAKKMERYSTLFAHQYRGKKRSSHAHAILHGGVAFLKNYFFKRGILGGREGWIISLYNTQTTYRKYCKLAELNNCHVAIPPASGVDKTGL